MKLNLNRKGLGIILGLSLASGAAFATPVGVGSFGASGAVYVSATMLDFSESAALPPGDQTALTNIPTTGVFSYLTGGEIINPMTNLNLGSATVSPTNIDFDGAVPVFLGLPGGIDLSLTNIPINTTVPVCTGTVADNVQGTLCRQSALSPIVLEQGPSGVTAILNLDGLAYVAGSDPTDGNTYIGKFSANFTSGPEATISGLLNEFTTTGSVTAPFSADFTTFATSTVPEPGTVTALGIGLLAIGLFNKKKRISKKSV